MGVFFFPSGHSTINLGYLAKFEHLHELGGIDFGGAIYCHLLRCLDRAFRQTGVVSSPQMGGFVILLELPLSLLKTAQGHPMLVELKNGETYNGHLVNCDTWMNIHLREVICTSKDGDRFWRLPECYIRGNTIKYLRVPDERHSGDLCLALDHALRETPLVEADISDDNIEIGFSLTRIFFYIGDPTSSLEWIGLYSPHVIDKVQEETNKSRSDRRPPGVGRGRGRGKEDGAGGRPAKGIGRSQDDGGGRGRARGGPGRSGGNRSGGRGRG
ncbi:hypothetical protein IFM89_029360 [Coptis chinensis]|uniref:Sm domain-containing protein n=1 Tax=Coptis chinensis TaxID=261450 RepID=A0A835MFP6_9MAGN|nr:hypothetical protein IFM89_029360 [Coptis chinensis]